jgi:uncharacterized membrane protein YraQ (UPF0718 family)
MSVFNIGGMYLAFPVAYMLLKKGAKLSVVLTYLGAAAVMRINLFIYEIHFLGLKFTLIRLCTSLPLIVLSSCLLPIIFKFNVTVEEK